MHQVVSLLGFGVGGWRGQKKCLNLAALLRWNEGCFLDLLGHRLGESANKKGKRALCLENNWLLAFFNLFFNFYNPLIKHRAAGFII